MRVEDVVSEINRSFYGAFEARDADAMGQVWEQSDRVTCVHPGWPVLRGWTAVAESWRRIFAHTPYIQFFLTDEEICVVGDTAWVTLYENILQEVGSSPATESTPRQDASLGDSRVAATNVFCQTGGIWRMVVHHGSPVASG